MLFLVGPLYSGRPFAPVAKSVAAVVFPGLSIGAPPAVNPPAIIVPVELACVELLLQLFRLSLLEAKMPMAT